jgi:hemoglobin
MARSNPLKKVYDHFGNNLQAAELAVEALVLEFYKRMAADPMLNHFFIGKNLESVAHKQTEFLLKSMGAPRVYLGRPPARAHDDLPPILEGHFKRRIVLLRSLLEERGLPRPVIDAWINFEQAFYSVIVKK